MNATGSAAAHGPSDDAIVVDAVVVMELAELCELLGQWLADDQDAAVSYDDHIGWAGSATDLREDLARLTHALLTSPFTLTTPEGPR
jgi:hypothetical protein